jgi:hypothetical protein
MQVDAFEKNRKILIATQLTAAQCKRAKHLDWSEREKYKTGDFTTEPKQ